MALTEAEIIKGIRQEKFDNLKWNPVERVFRRRPKYRSRLLRGHQVPFSLAAEVKFRSSIFGTFLDSFNNQQKQDKYLNNNKLEIAQWDLKFMTSMQKLLFNQRNDMTHDWQSLLNKAVKEEDCIDWEYLYRHLFTLRIDDYHITALDNELKKFRNLQVLVLCGNWIEEVPGQFLPRKLQFLELYSNEVSCIKSICKSPPKKLLHIGLGKNKLTDDSNFETLKKCANKFSMLRSLDLSDNDICDLLSVLEPLQSITMLKSLQLQGNPCSTCIAYKEAVFSKLPNLVYLDNTEVLRRDKNIKRFSHENLFRGALVFTCHRIVGLPAPPKQKGIVQTIHLEITLPLLEEIILDIPEEPEEEKKDDKKGKGKKDSSAKKSKSSKKGSKKGAPSPYEADDEYENERKSKVRDNSFKTQRVPWAKIIQLPDDAIVVEPPEQNLVALRDTFKSTVNVKVVYLKVQPPEKPKKGKSASKGTKGKDKGKKGDAKAKPEEPPKEPKETILKKVTLANFFCDLRDVNWSDKTIDFYWAAHPKCSKKAIPVEGSLRAISYMEGKGKKVEKPKKGEPVGQPGEVERIPSKQFLPNIFTCQVGFGLKRSFPVF